MTLPIDAYDSLLIVALALVTLVTRSFFLFSNRDLKIPKLIQRGLLYAPIAALAAVIAPEILTSQGHFIASIFDARPFSTVAAGLFFFKFRHKRQVVLGSMLVGMVSYLLLHLGLGW
jgi:branched-subunit amino acid transport protein